MHSDTFPLLPSGLKECLEALALPCLPPLPLSALERLEEVAPFFFASDGRPVRRMEYPEDRDALLDSSEGEGRESAGESASLPALRYAAFGLVGSGLQDAHFLYLLDVPGLRLGLSLPWGHAYGDAETERDDLAAALRLAGACQRNIPERGTLRVFFGPSSCLWEYAGNTPSQGEDAASLLDFLTFLPQSEEIPAHLWMRV